jgi:hypothetical protein
MSRIETMVSNYAEVFNNKMSLKIQKDIVCDIIYANTAVSQLASEQAVRPAPTPEPFLVSSNFIPSNKLDSTTVTLTTGSTFQAGLKYAGGALASNGLIYCAPCQATNILAINPENNTASTRLVTLSTGSVLLANSDYFGAVLAPNGKIYCIPFRNSNVGVIDPETNIFSTTLVTLAAGSSIPAGGDKWIGGCLATNGKIYGIPQNATDILVIDPETNIASTTLVSGTTGSTLSGTLKWYGGALAPNGKIYAATRASTSVLVIDPFTNTFDTTSVSLTTGSTFFGAYANAVLAQNGKIYCVPRGAEFICIIDPEKNTFDTTSITLSAGSTLSGGSNKYGGGVLAMDGKIYGISRLASSILVVDPETNIASTTTISLSSGSTFGDCFGCVLAPNGKIYGVPYTSITMPIVAPSIPKFLPWMLAPEFNKF